MTARAPFLGFLVVAITVALPLSSRAAEPPPRIAPRARVIVDNDFGGDPDGLFQLAQLLLSPSVEVRGVIGSHNYPQGFYGAPGSADYACVVARRLLELIAPGQSINLCAGANGSLPDVTTPAMSAGARLIVREAMRDDAKTPLYVACGGGLTDIASALLMEPAIARHLTLIWIGGPEYAGLANPIPGGPKREYNLGIDLKAAQIVFNRSAVPLWQVPRDAYRQCLVSDAELRRNIDHRGRLGAFLLDRLDDIRKAAHGRLGEAYVLGDSPLVLLTALQSGWEADASSSAYRSVHASAITDQGWYDATSPGRLIRVYTHLDTRLMFADLYAKLAEFDSR